MNAIFDTEKEEMKDVENMYYQDQTTHIKLGGTRGTNELALTHVACAARQYPVPHH